MKHRNRRGKALPEESPGVASNMECTGLMPALPENDAQDEAEAALYGIHDGNGSRTGA